jgi:acetyl esterase
MPLDPQFRSMLGLLQEAGALPLVREDAERTRAHYRTLAVSRRTPDFTPEQVASVDDRHSPEGVPVRVYEPLRPAGGTVIYLHGGGWVIGDLDTHDPLARRLTNAIGARVVSVDYRLAPEHPFPAGLDDATSVLAWVRSQEPGHGIGVAGDSAGASLAAGLAIRARDKGIPLTAQMLLYPATDPLLSSPSVTENGDGYFLTASDMTWFYEQYLPAGAAYPEADLAHAGLSGVAPAVVATAEFDPLRDEGAAYASRLEKAGVPVTYVPGPGLIHGFAPFFSAVGTADTAVEKIFAAFRELMPA